MAQSISGQLAEFIGECGIRKIPPEVVERAGVFVMDYLGVALTASSARSSQIIGDVVAELGGRETCTVIGRDYRTNALFAALVNGTTGHAVEMDDDHRTSVLHPAVAVVPAALAA
ncbi:MAG: MmgE/PrpD family protein, partial [Betaproteobacteria bacterium]|nr:MmgE/PrpD family protein [Betaproteobacteria bacterium]